MAELVEWLPDGTPRSPRFGDIYRSASGGLEQARHVFLAGCGLPGAWAGQDRWRILETGFGLGLNFLATWQAWRDDPQRPRLLHYASVEAWPVSAGDILRSAAPWPELVPLAQALAARWRGLLPGTHRLAFEEGRVLLTLHVGDAPRVLREERCVADSIFLDGFEPSANPDMWSPATLRAVSRQARRGTGVATWTVAGSVRTVLAECGFVVGKTDGLPPKRQCLRGRYEPAWAVPGPPAAAEPRQALVIGAGLAGAAVAASLARRGWAVRVLDAAPRPAAGASSLPVGLFAPHQSPDDGALSRLTRCGLRMTWQALHALARGRDWDDGGVLERDGRLPRDGEAPEWADWTRPASSAECEHGGLAPGSQAAWHALAGWARPGALVARWLAEPGVQFQGGRAAAELQEAGGDWRVLDAGGETLGTAPLVVVAAALQSATLLPGLPLQPVRGQVSWGLRAGLPLRTPGPVNGNGHLVPCAPSPDGEAWYCGATFGRGDAALDVRASDHAANLERLRALLPDVAAVLAPQFESGGVRAWTGVRCASRDRRPLVGELAPGLWTSCAMGSRGLTFALLCAELLAARLHAEPLPLPARLAAALDVARLRRPAAGNAAGPAGHAAGPDGAGGA